MNKILFSFIILSLAGCRVGPDYHPPRSTMPNHWISSDVGQNIDECPPPCWWDIFEDPQLSIYIQESAMFNRNVQIALMNIVEARAERARVTSKLFPSIDFDQRYNRNSFNLFGFGGGGGAQPVVPLATNTDQEILFAGLDAFWEIDLFGRTRREIEAACARIGSAWENYRDVMITVFGEVARNYMEVRMNQEKIELTTEEIQFLQEDLRLIQQKREDGISNEIELCQTRSDLKFLEASLTSLYAEMYGGVYRLSILLGRFPEDLIDEMKEFRSLPKSPDLIHTGLPVELLRRRPSIRKAERDLAASTADIGVAVAEYFPNFSLSGSIGYQKFKGPGFLDDGFVWSYSTRLLQSIFNAGRIWANVQSKKAQAIQAFYSYEQSILEAVGEAEQAIMNVGQAQERSDALKSRWLEQECISQMTRELYQSGISDRLSVLDAEQQELESQKDWIDGQASLIFEIITLYKVLGGGWECQAN